MPRYVENRDNVYAAVDSERTYQNKWDNAESEGNHSIVEFIAYMQDYLNEAMHMQSRNAAEHVKKQCLDNMRKVTALGVACMEQHGAPHRE